jgi:hypothetical protein
VECATPGNTGADARAYTSRFYKFENAVKIPQDLLDIRLQWKKP